MKDLREQGHRDRFAFRRRCGWCGVQLRAWQRNLCRRCALGVGEPMVTTSPCNEQSRWNADPDHWQWPW